MSYLDNFHAIILNEDINELNRFFFRGIIGNKGKTSLLKDVNSAGSDALTFACLTGNIEVIEYVNEARKLHGIGICNYEKRSPIDYLLHHMKALREKIKELEKTAEGRKPKANDTFAGYWI